MRSNHCGFAGIDREDSPTLMGGVNLFFGEAAVNADPASQQKVCVKASCARDRHATWRKES